MQTRTIAILLFSTACGPSIGVDDSEASTSTSVGSTSTGTTAPQPEDGSSTTTTEPVADSTGESSSTGDPFTFSADEALWELPCGEAGPRAWIEIYPGLLDGECLPPPGLVDDFAIIAIEPWDGRGGTFVIDPEGPHRAGLGLDPELATGEVTLEVSAPWTLVSATIDLATPTASLAGTADLSACGAPEPADPCG